MTKLHPFPLLTLSLSVLLLVLFAIQYPLQTSFPIGGDAASYIRSATSILEINTSPTEAWSAIRFSNYPLSQLVFASSALLPLSWPDRFVIAMSSAQILAALALGFFTWRIAGWPAAATSVAIWALSPIDINNHFEDGTFAQLFSLSFLLLSLESLARNSRFGVVFFGILSFLSHPFTGLLLFASLAIGSTSLLPIRKRLTNHQAQLTFFLGLTTATITAYAVYYLARFGPNWPNTLYQTNPDSFFLDKIKSSFSIWLALSIPGLAIITRILAKKPLLLTSLLGFFWLATYQSLNPFIDPILWPNRFHTYLIVSIAILAGLALPTLLQKTFRHHLSQLGLIIILLLSLAAITWRHNTQIYSQYEHPSNYKRLHEQEQAALIWLRDNLPTGTFIATSTADRRGEWIPIYTQHQWQEVNDNHLLFQPVNQDLYQATQELPFTHLLLFKHRDGATDSYHQNPDLFPPVFTNDYILVVQLP